MSAAKPTCTYFFITSSPASASSDASKCGNACSACTQARITNASGVSLMPRAAASSLSCARVASISVMSASSNCVTCGTLTQLACRRGPEIFWMRLSGLRSTGPNAAKSTGGTRGSAAPRRRRRLGQQPLDVRLDVLLGDAALGAAAPDPAEVHAQLAREAPDRRAGMRSRESRSRSTAPPPAAARAGAALRRGCGRGLARGLGGRLGARLARGGAIGPSPRPVARPLPLARETVAAAAPSTIAIRSPCDTRLPRCTLSSRTTPAAVDGTSIVAFSVSSVISGGIDRDRVARLHQHVDDLDVLEVADVGHAHFDQVAPWRVPLRP